MRDQYKRRAIAVDGDRVPDLGDLAPAELLVSQRALQRMPGLRLPKGQPACVQTATAWARQDSAHDDAVLPERLTDPPRLRPAPLI